MVIVLGVEKQKIEIKGALIMVLTSTVSQIVLLVVATIVFLILAVISCLILYKYLILVKKNLEYQR